MTILPVPFRRTTAALVLALLCAAAALADPAAGPLSVHPGNPRWLADTSGRAVVLAGSHTWAIFQDIGSPAAEPLDWRGFLDMLVAHGHNYTRGWMFEQPSRVSWSDEPVAVSPLPWKRTGPGVATDGLPKFDLDAFDEAYFARLRERPAEAGRRGIYVSVMLFQGWSLDKSGNPGSDPWLVHPMNAANNVQAVGAADGRADRDDAPTVHSLGNPALLAKQQAYVRKVVDTVNDLRITAGMTNDDLFRSPADWISVAGEPQDWTHPGSSYLQDYRDNPPASDGSKVVFSDTDHLWGHGGNWKWAWKSLLRGLHPVFMDSWGPLAGEPSPRIAAWMLVSNGNCLAAPGTEYLVYAPDGGSVTLDLRGAPGPFATEWRVPLTGQTIGLPEKIQGGDYAVLAVPFTGDAVLHLVRR